MDFNKLAIELIREIKSLGITDNYIAHHLGISRQAFARRRDTDNFTTSDLTTLAAMSITLVGGSVLVDFMEGRK